MPRTSKYQSTEAALIAAPLWRAALYVRLSREDGDKEESDSIANQRTMLMDHVALQSDVLVHDVYIDDGYTGTHFERPAFQRMLADLKERVVNCVIVKDLSRLGRNYIEVGQYIEKIFPFMDVRFISINDMLDSVKNPQAMNNLVVPFKNIINDEYCRDISNKVRSSLDMKRRQGKFIGSFATYGYQKDPFDHNHLIVDEEAAATVRDVFAWFVGGMTIIGIAKRLSELGVPNPSAYKRMKGMRYAHPCAERADGLWVDSSVRRILQNRMYTGCLVQGKNRTKSYKLPQSVMVPKKDWIVVPDTHEAIIEQALFDKAQSLFRRDMRAAPQSGRVSLLAGFLKCADCGRAMHRKHISQPYKQYDYYLCSTFKKMRSGACTKHTIRTDKVEAALLATLQKQIALAVEMDELIARIHQSASVQKSNARLLSAVAKKEQEKAAISQMKLSLYPDWKNGDITKEEYHRLREHLDRQLEAAETSLSRLRQELQNAEAGAHGDDFLAAFIKHRNLDTLTREVLVELVDVIYVHEGGALTIHFRFADAFEQASAFIELNRSSI